MLDLSQALLVLIILRKTFIAVNKRLLAFAMGKQSEASALLAKAERCIDSTVVAGALQHV